MTRNEKIKAIEACISLATYRGEESVAGGTRRVRRMNAANKGIERLVLRLSRHIHN